MKYLWTILIILYVLSPVDLLPESLLGLWGWIDDFVLVVLYWQYLRRNGNPAGGFQYRRQHTADRPGGEKGNNSRDQKTGYRYRSDRRSAEDPYAVLGVSRQSHPDEIKSAYRELAAKYHPDKVQHLGEEFQKLAEARFKEIEKAYRQIKAGQ